MTWHLVAEQRCHFPHRYAFRSQPSRDGMAEAVGVGVFGKALKVEVAVQLVERFVLVELRDQRFFSLSELNVAIRARVASINSKVMRGFGQSRNDLLESLDRPALSALPEKAYSFAEWKRPRVAPDYHVVTKRVGRDEIGGHYYSVPSKLIREVVDARITGATVEIFHKSQRIACHVFSAVKHRHTTITEHMPSAHHADACGARRRYAAWTPAKMMDEAAGIGSHAVALFEAIMKAKPHPEQGFRSCLGIIGLGKSYGIARLEAAARRGFAKGGWHPKSGLLFWHDEETGEAYENWDKAFEAVRVAAKITPRLTWHDLRRTYGCRRLQDDGLSMEEVRDLLGHSSVAVTEKHYAFLAAGAIAEKLKKKRAA